METPLSSTPAQRVVDRISPTLRHNVNVMDATGLIIASRDTARIGTLHAGARKAAATGTAVLIHRDEEHEGGLAGANMPFEIDGRVVGVVGLSGDPATVSPLAEVAALALKLLLEREREVDAAARRDALARPASPNAAAPLAPPWRLAALLRPPSGGSVRVDSPTDSTAAPATAAAGASDDVTDLFARSGRYRWASFRGATWVLLGTSEHDAGALAAAAVSSGVVPFAAGLGEGSGRPRRQARRPAPVRWWTARPGPRCGTGGRVHAARELAAHGGTRCHPLGHPAADAGRLHGGRRLRFRSRKGPVCAPQHRDPKTGSDSRVHGPESARSAAGVVPAAGSGRCPVVDSSPAGRERIAAR